MEFFTNLRNLSYLTHRCPTSSNTGFVGKGCQSAAAAAHATETGSGLSSHCPGTAVFGAAPWSRTLQPLGFSISFTGHACQHAWHAAVLSCASCARIACPVYSVLFRLDNDKSVFECLVRRIWSVGSHKVCRRVLMPGFYCPSRRRCGACHLLPLTRAQTILTMQAVSGERHDGCHYGNCCRFVPSFRHDCHRLPWLEA